MNDLRSHRRLLYDGMRDRLRQATSLAATTDIDAVLAAAEFYDPNEIGAEQRALQRHRDAQGKVVLKEFQRLGRSRDYAEVAVSGGRGSSCRRQQL